MISGRSSHEQPSSGPATASGSRGGRSSSITNTDAALATRHVQSVLRPISVLRFWIRRV